MRFLIMIVIGSLTLPAFAQHLNSKPDSSWIILHTDSSHPQADIAVYDLVPFNHAQAPHFPPMKGGFAIDRPVTAYIHFIDKEYFEVTVIPKDTLHIYLDHDTLAFKGKSVEINRFKERKRLQSGAYTIADKMFAAAIDSISIDSAVKRINWYETTDIAMLNANKSLPQWFKKREIARCHVLGAFYRITTANKRKVPADIAGMDTLLNKDAKVMYDEQIYHILLSYYLECRFPNESNLMKQYKQASAHLDEVIKDPYLRQVYKSYTVTMFLSYGSNLNDWEEKHKQWNSMQADIKDVALKTAVNAGFKEKKLLLNGPASLHKGDAIPAFSVIDKDGNTITQNDITGGWVYLTLWGTWCEPCRNEIPEKNKLGLANSNLRIVNICGRSKEAEWRKMIPDIAGINLYADRASIDQIEKGFRLQGYPHHVLISPEGKIYENGTLRPAEMPALLDKLLYQVNTNAINAR